MSSISSSDRARQTDEIRQAREEYQNSEAETARRNKAEKKRLQELHEQEIKRLRTEYDRQIDSMRNKHKDTLTARDQQHLEQMDKIKGLYLEQNRRRTEDAEVNRQAQKKAYQGEIDSLKKTTEQQKEVLTRNFRESMQERDEQFGEFQNRAQSTITKSIEERTQKLNEKHENELGAVIEDRDRKVADLSQQKAELQAHSRREMKEKDRLHGREKTRLNDHFAKVHSAQEELHNSLFAGRDEMLRAERENTREQYNKALEDKLQKMDAAHEQLRNQVDERMDSQIRSLSHELHKSKTDRVAETISNRRLRDLERKNILNATHERVEDLEKQKTQIVEVVNDQARQKVDNVLRRADQIVSETNRNNRLKANLQDQQSRESRAQLEFELKNRVEQVQDRAETRLRRMQNITNDQVVEQQKYHEKNVDLLKTNYTETLAAQREAQMQVIQDVRMRAEQRLREQEVKATRKLEEAVANYEAKLEKMQEEHRQEKTRMNQIFEQRMAQREKGFKNDQESLAMKYEAKLAQSNEVRQKELERVERRHQEQMVSLANRVKYFDKKA